MEGSRIAGLLLCTALAACTSRTPPSPPAEQNVHDGVFRLLPVREIGTLEGPTAFETITIVATDDSGRIAVWENRSCRVSILDTLGFRRRTFGRCGEGPSDLSKLDGLSLAAGNIWVTDWQAPGILRRFDLQGQLTERYALQSQTGTLEGAAGLMVLGDSLALVNRQLFGPSIRAKEPRIILYRLSSLAVAERLAPLADSVVAFHEVSATESVPSCVVAAADGRYRYAYLDQWSWSGETGELLGGTAPRSFTERIAWASPTRNFHTELGKFRPGIFGSAVICADSGPILWGRYIDYAARPPATPADMGGRIEQRDWNGHLVSARDFGPNDSIYGMKPVGAIGDLIVLKGVAGGGWPVLRLMRLPRPVPQ